MKKIGLLILLTTSFLLGFSQIKGKVVDKETKQGLSNVNILKKHSGLGVSTNKKGLFSLKYFKIGDTLIVSHVAYQKAIIIVTESDINIRLSPKKNALEEASVYSKKTAQKIVENPWVIDYEIVNDSTLLIAKIGNKGSRVELLIHQKSNSFQLSDIDRIEKTCADDFYIIRKDSAFNIEIMDGELYLTSFLTLKTFEYVEKFCTKTIKGVQYFNYFTALNKVFVLNTFQDSLPLPFYSIVDMEGFRYNAPSYFGAQSIAARIKEESQCMEIEGHRMGENSVGDTLYYKRSSTFRLKDDLEDYAAALIKIKTKSLLIEYKDSLMVLDNVNSKIISFDVQHQVVHKKPFQLSFKNSDIKDIIQDPSNEKIYYVVQENRSTNIYQFNFETLTFQYLLSRNQYIEEIKINNGILYYLDYKAEKETRELYKIAL